VNADEMPDQTFRELAQLRTRVELTAPPGRATSLALTKLDEAWLWLREAYETANPR
jgi:hypothetical protein